MKYKFDFCDEENEKETPKIENKQIDKIRT